MPNRYRNIRTKKSLEGKRYLVNPIYPDIPVTENDTYLITTGGDRYDTLALQFYGDSSLWWIIASANSPAKRDSIALVPGVQLRVPADKDAAFLAFENLNSSR